MLDPDATTGLGTLGPPDNIKKLQVETRTYGENIKHKHKIQTPNNTNITLDYMEYLETKYSWSDYVTREDLPRILEDKFSCFVKSTHAQQRQGGKGWNIPQKQEGQEHPVVPH